MVATGDSRWMTYAELAMARGIKEPAAVRLVQRRKWGTTQHSCCEVQSKHGTPGSDTLEEKLR